MDEQKLAEMLIRRTESGRLSWAIRHPYVGPYSESIYCTQLGALELEIRGNQIYSSGYKIGKIDFSDMDKICKAMEKTGLYFRQHPGNGGEGWETNPDWTQAYLEARLKFETRSNPQ